jgi:2-polyprenyl-3-methyl-5-hydroxy-6-metoxy-1,4-benzoquinol methylase
MKIDIGCGMAIAVWGWLNRMRQPSRMKRIFGAIYRFGTQIPQEIVEGAERYAREFLKVNADEFDNLAREWPNLSKELWKGKSPVEFYTSWKGIYGRANICANIRDQFSRNIVYYELKENVKQKKVFLDYGCGTGVMFFPFIKRFEKSYLLDVKNLAKDFLKFRCSKYGLTPIVLNEKEYNLIPNGSVDLSICIDVLEHIRDPSFLFSVIDSKLKRGSILIFRAPFKASHHEPFLIGVKREVKNYFRIIIGG